MSTRRRPIVVGVDGSEAGWRALDWGAAEAEVRARPLRVVHVIKKFAEFGGSPHTTSEEHTAEGRLILQESRMRVMADRPSMAVPKTVMLEGRAPAVLLESFEDAALIVLGHRAMRRIERLAVGSTSEAVAARAHVPVVVVPENAELGKPHIVLGVDWSESDERAIEFAFDYAQAHDCFLVAVTAWEAPPPAFGEALMGQLEALRVAAETSATEAIAAWRDKYPDVAVLTEGLRGHAGEALARRAEGTRLLVIGGHAHPRLGAYYPGSTAHAVIRNAACPVAVIHGM